VEIDVRRRDFTRLQDRESSLRIAPLDVLGKAEVLLDAKSDPGQLRDLVVSQRLDRSEVLRHIDLAAALSRVVPDRHDLLLVNLLLHDLEGILVDDVLIRVDPPGDDCLAEPPARIQEDLLRVRRHRIRGEHDARHLRRKHLLDDHGQEHVLVLESPLVPVGDGAVGPQRRPATLDVLENRVRTVDVQVRVLLTSERHAGQILGRCRGSNGYLHVAPQL
jgi:hypothetical protein